MTDDLMARLRATIAEARLSRGVVAMTDNMPPETRRAVASAGGRARIDALTPEQATELGRAGAARANAPAALARRIVKAWPDMSRADRAEVRAILADVMPRAGRSAGSDLASDVSP